MLEAIRSEFPSLTNFERDFPSLCFALATGVGKTRLMGGAGAASDQHCSDRLIVHPLTCSPNRSLAPSRARSGRF
ncbi:MAG: hypothetical protein DVS81_20060 [Candidatus Accumulibacter meliphilus]|jgi:hypothetical protein|uniref:Uncharacterized protein n=1 Tax=Candidatus Accumulibacter meliphilus TaxID=2211374 RepID=A0A369XN64_9PROT|nr:MAG: hypothetical protein DVS81_20060 [Candidatus Accumulibacter meliphilus]